MLSGRRWRVRRSTGICSAVALLDAGEPGLCVAAVGSPRELQARPAAKMGAAKHKAIRPGASVLTAVVASLTAREWAIVVRHDWRVDEIEP